MKKTLTLLAMSPAVAMAQSLVSTSPQLRTVLLEDFTGIHCGYCPEAHVIGDNLEDMHKDQFVFVGVHAGGFAVPNQGEPDFRTPEGTAIDAHFAPSGYPNGVIDRHTFAAGTSLGRGAWDAATTEALGFTSPVNVGVESSFDSNTRDLTVNVVLYYTANSPGGSDYIGVFLKESNIIGWQTDYGPNGNNANYNHTDVLRHYLTDVWGDEVTTTTQGTTVTRTYTWNVPIDFNIANCEVVAHAGEYQTEVYQAREVPADGGTTLIIGDMALTSANDHAAGTNGSGTLFETEFTNALGANGDFIVELTTINAPAGWNEYFTIQGTDYLVPATVPFADGTAEAIAVNITPDGTPGIGDYLLSIRSASNMLAPAIEQEFHVISGVTDLIINNPTAETWVTRYEAGLVGANQPNRATTSRNTFINFGAANALSGVNNVYYNVSWTFPSITDAVVAQLETFMDAGGNLMICGQDIGWDNSGAAGSNGTPITEAFYEDYMLATYVADGSTTDNQANFEDADGVFGGLPSTTISDVFGGSNMYPEQITPIAPAVPIMKYNATAKVGGLRAQTTNYKLVYFGIGPEQLADAAVGEQMVKLSHDWFYGLVGVEEFDAALAAALGSAYPVPADAQATVPLNGLTEGAVLRVHDARGALVSEQRIAANSTQAVITTAGLPSGMYSYQLLGNSGASAARTLVVTH
ncbi:MAG: Omp28-related outer membrane protein [Flavobacteriales bacterium]|nr:Omp28-related outer membrane protein [Flavobacteriales bacterium]